jgi:hypothetical protein
VVDATQADPERAARAGDERRRTADIVVDLMAR